MANDQTVQIKGTATVRMSYKGDKHYILVYILNQTSHPFILGTSYLIDNKITIDFGNLNVLQKCANVRCRKRVTVDPHSEIIIWGKLPRNIQYGLQGLCESSSKILSKGLICSKAVANVSENRTVPVKILNLGNDSITIPKGKIIAKFSQLTDDFEVRQVDFSDNIPVVQHIDIGKHGPREKLDTCTKDSDFLANFELNADLKGD